MKKAPGIVNFLESFVNKKCNFLVSMGVKFLTPFVIYRHKKHKTQKLMKLEHRYRKYGDRNGRVYSYDWTFTFKHNGVIYTGDIEYSTGWSKDGSDGHFMGYLRSPYIQRTYKNTYIVFGYSDVRNNVNYILKAMKEVIEGDFSNVKGVGNYVCDISKLKNN